MQAQRTDEWLNLCEVKYVKLYDKNWLGETITISSYHYTGGIKMTITSFS